MGLYDGKYAIRILLLVTVSVFAATTPACSTWINSDWGDCGYSAYFKTDKDGGPTEIIFSRVTAEELNGHRNCGFQYIRTKVDRAEIDGAVLPERVEADKFGQNTYYYAVPVGFDSRTTPITIDVKGWKYRSDPASANKTDKNANIKLNPL